MKTPGRVISRPVLCDTLRLRATDQVLRRLVAICRRIAAGDLSQRANLEARRAEVGQLGSAFDEMVERLETTFASQRRFTADAAHELRTPLTALEGSLEVLLRGSQDDPAAIRRLVRAMHMDTQRLTRMAEQLLDLARLDAPTPLYRQDIELSELLGGFMSRARVLTRERSLTLVPGPPVRIDADPDALRQVLFNLVDNAAQHTSPGGIVQLTWSVDDGVARISVWDDGEGIAEADLAHVFEPFYRGDRSRSRRRGGTGLGLTLAREIARAHGGELSAASDPGAGATMTVMLPAYVRRRSAS